LTSDLGIRDPSILLNNVHYLLVNIVNHSVSTSTDRIINGCWTCQEKNDR
jgi:hypothetical protein